MRFPVHFLALIGAAAANSADYTSRPTVVDTAHNVTYHGLARNGIDVFLGIHFGQDTSGANRFKPPRSVEHPPGTVVDATNFGPACPQVLGNLVPPLALTNVSEVSEDYLHVNVARPKGAKPGDKLPVLVWIHGGSFWVGQNREITNAPDGMILKSIENGLPIIHVAVQYRLGGRWTPARP